MMNRRTLLAAAPAMAGTLSLDADAKASQIPDERPPFDIMPEGSGWKIRSWEWAEDAWRPKIARALRVADGIRIEGPVAPADLDAIRQRL
ncbi:hypothetical protein [uncultured Sphingomonas sp.]|uniref:hypothetical protein n=1 Tax=uncultured Sphingomonas sp. TaxID=158754 RepID=UPI002621DF15|nr:hypothetical protein [uncultured Sphingomonas sp.]